MPDKPTRTSDKTPPPSGDPGPDASASGGSGAEGVWKRVPPEQDPRETPFVHRPAKDQPGKDHKDR